MLSRALQLPMSLIHSAQRQYHRRSYFPRLCQRVTHKLAPFSTAQYQRDLASHNILCAMRSHRAWIEHYSQHDLGAEAAKIVINEIRESPADG